MTSVSAGSIDLDRFTWAEWGDNPYPLYRQLRHERPVYRDELNRSYVVTRADDLFSILGDPEQFSSVSVDVRDGNVPRMSPLKDEDPPRHGFLRKIVKPLLTPGAMRRRESYLEMVACSLLDDAEKGDVIEVSSQLGVRLPGRVTVDLIGLPLEDHPRFHELVHERHLLLMERDGRVERLERARSLGDVNTDMWTMLAPVIAQRRAEPREDMISACIAAQEQFGKEDFSDEVFLDMMLHLMTGGFETTQHLIELLCDYLADHPDTWEQLQRDRSLVSRGIDEMLRWESPVQALDRRATSDIEMRGVEIPRDSKITVVYGSANRDELAFEDPDRFRLDRKANRHLAFSYGIHYCVGAPLSRYEVKALLDEMLDRYSHIERAGPSEPMPEIAPRVTVGKMRGFGKVPVRLVRKH